VRPLRRLARAAIRVRLGRAREVVVPRLPERSDEIGLLARALSDMSQALRARIDATESFAADVTHELKNPLASLRSAVEGLNTVKKIRNCRSNCSRSSRRRAPARPADHRYFRRVAARRAAQPRDVRAGRSSAR
jgi:signal transduction histidine kinase